MTGPVEERANRPLYPINNSTSGNAQSTNGGNNDIDKKIDGLLGNRANLVADKTGFETSAASAGQDAVAADQQVQEFHSQIGPLESNYADISTQIDTTISSLGDIQSQIDDKLGMLSQMQEARDSKSVNNETSEDQKVGSTIYALRYEIQDLQKQKEALEKQQDGLKSQKESIGKSIENMHGYIDSATKKGESARDIQNQLNRKIDNTNKQIAEVDSKIKQAEQERDKAKELNRNVSSNKNFTTLQGLHDRGYGRGLEVFNLNADRNGVFAKKGDDVKLGNPLEGLKNIGKFLGGKPHYNASDSWNNNDGIYNVFGKKSK